MDIRHLFILPPLILLVGCTTNPARESAAPLTLREAEQYYEQALEDDPELMEDNSEEKIRSLYRLGRVKGFLCEWEWAEDLLKEAVMREDERAESDNTPSISRKSIEVARLYFDRGLFEPSLPYFSQGIETAKENGLMEDDPIAFAEIYEEYALALEQTEARQEAQAARGAAATLRKNHPALRAKYVADRYWATCPPEVEARRVDINGWDGSH